MDTDSNSEIDNSDVPYWHKDLVRKRLAEYKNNPQIAIDFDAAMDEIENAL